MPFSGSRHNQACRADGQEMEGCKSRRHGFALIA